jgi:putative Holliday junction resolvase
MFLCLDLGEKRIGMASGNLEARLATPIGVFEHKSRKSDIEIILQTISKYTITDVVIGISYQEDGTPNSMGRHSLSFGSDLEKATSIQVTYWDEALSTRTAKELRLETGAGMKKRQGHQDAVAAAVILQSFFENITQQDQSNS